MGTRLALSGLRSLERWNPRGLTVILDVLANSHFLEHWHLKMGQTGQNIASAGNK